MLFVDGNFFRERRLISIAGCLNGCWILLNDFSAFLAGSYVTFFLFCICYNGKLHYLIFHVEPTLLSWDKPVRLWCITLCMYCWIQFANILMMIFHLIHEGYWSTILFFLNVWFCECNAVLMNWLRSVFSSRMYLKMFCRIVITSSFMFGGIYQRIHLEFSFLEGIWVRVLFLQ